MRNEEIGSFGNSVEKKVKNTVEIFTKHLADLQYDECSKALVGDDTRT